MHSISWKLNLLLKSNDTEDQNSVLNVMNRIRFISELLHRAKIIVKDVNDPTIGTGT